ncbi:DUF4157 domain-containing protein [Streptomyces sp. NPDC005808]|uniref:eCIS core domain-containing protein n=1 Tax=Streptomyces sp. NPDC005808 TaxID=3364734 RepID=UPI0036B4828C
MPSTTPDRLLTLQRLAGNAAVARAVEEERHEHGPGCAHERTAVEQPSLQRSSVSEALLSPARPLESRIRERAEQGLGMDLGDVRVHSGPVAQRSALEFGARAYTTGKDIVVGPGGADDETMYHELTHVHQQSLGPVAGADNGTGTKVSHKDDPFERHAADSGRQLAQGIAPSLSVPGVGSHNDPVQRAASTSARPAAGAGTTVQRMPRSSGDEMEVDSTPDYSSGPDASHDNDSEGYEWEETEYLAERSRADRDTTADPQPAAGFGKSKHGINPKKLKTLRHDKHNRQAPELKYRKDDKPLFRFDKRSPEQIMDEGFKSWNEEVPRSLRLYQKELHKTGFVSATRSAGDYVPDWARQPDGSAYRYQMNPPGGIDLVDSLGTVSFAQQQEVVFWKGVRPEFVSGFDKVDASGNVVESMNRSEWKRHKSEKGKGKGKDRRSPSPMDIDG